MKNKGAKKKKGGKKGRRGAASTSSPAQNVDTTVVDNTQETTTQPTQETTTTTPTQPTQPTQETTERVAVKIEEGTETQETEAKPTQPKGASSSSARFALDDDEEEDPDVKPLIRRSSKRNRSETKEPAAEDNSPTPTPSTVKRAKTTKAKESEVEYFKDKRSLEDLWKSAFPVGTEFGQLEELYKSEWDFTNLEEALEEDGKLYGKRVYVFGCTESHTVPDKDETKTVLVPLVICVASSIPPFDNIATTLNDVEKLNPLKDMKLAWEPFIPLEKRHKQVDRMKFQIHVLGCTQRKSAAIKEDRVKKFNSCLPYIDNPYREDESEQSTVAKITFPSEPPVALKYDWASDNLEAFTDQLIQAEAVLADREDEFKEFVKVEVAKAKAAYEEAKQARETAREAAINKLSEETKAAYQAMKLYKFYPQPSPDTTYLSAIEKSPLINKYFGKADEVL